MIDQEKPQVSDQPQPQVIVQEQPQVMDQQQPQAIDQQQSQPFEQRVCQEDVDDNMFLTAKMSKDKSVKWFFKPLPL